MEAINVPVLYLGIWTAFVAVLFFCGGHLRGRLSREEYDAMVRGDAPRNMNDPCPKCGKEMYTLATGSPACVCGFKY